MNLFLKKEFIVVFIILFIIKFDYSVLGQNNSDGSNETGLISTYKSIPEILVEDFVSILDSGNNSSSIITRTFSELLEAVEDEIKPIFPGTEWCGSGNIAKSTSELGYFDKTDRCCRSHDSCSGSLIAGKFKGPLINDGLFTRSTCSCDNDFYNCLKNVDTEVAKAIGDTYFNLLRPQCYNESYPIESCAVRENNGFSSKRCLKYNFDESRNKTLQWLDNPVF